MSEKFIKVGAAILAAGKASRFQAPKMLLPVFGKPLLQHLLHICDIFVETVVISGFWHTAIAESLSGSQTTLLFNDRYESGIASSLQLAAKYAQQKQWDGLAIVLGDTFVEQRHLEKLLALFKSSLRIVATTKEGVLQPPVLFPAAYYLFLKICLAIKVWVRGCVPDKTYRPQLPKKRLWISIAGRTIAVLSI